MEKSVCMCVCKRENGKKGDIKQTWQMVLQWEYNE